MTMDDVKKEMQYKKTDTIKQYFPDGWISGRGGMRIKTISFARQLAELSNREEESPCETPQNAAWPSGPRPSCSG